MSSIPPFSLDAPRYNQETYYGRWRHFAELVDPRMLFTTDEELESSKELLNRFKTGTLKINEATDEQLWKARQVKEAITHPQTGEKLPLLCRLSAFVPVNIPICAGMILSPPTLFNTLFWQWTNQSYNAGFNYANRNASSEQATSAIMQAYFSATAVSCISAVGLGKLVERASSLPPAIRQAIQRTVPFVAVAAAGSFNAVFMRQNELTEGIDLTDEEGKTHGKSINAAKKSLTEVALTRVALPMPILLLPPYILQAMEKTKIMPKHRFGRVATELTVITLCLLGAFPAAVALFPQTGSINVNEVEKGFHALYTTKGEKIHTLYYNKGI